MYTALFSHGKIGFLTTRNRIIAAPLERNLCDRHGRPGLAFVESVRERASGGAGLLLPEAAFIHPAGRGSVFQLGVHDDTFLPDLRAVAAAAHESDAAIGMQINFAGRQAQSAINFRQPVSVSGRACPVFGLLDAPHTLTEPEIEEIVGHFGAAAARVKEAGFDLVELHGASGYLLGEFLSPLHNRRTDVFGGPFENRARFPLQVYEAVRRAVGPQFPVAYRLCVDEFHPEGITFDDVLRFALLLEERGLDLIDVAVGTYESRWKSVPMADSPAGVNVPIAARIRSAVTIPVSVSGRLNDPADAEAALSQGSADFVSISRALHADPEWPNKAFCGKDSEIRPCIACQYCADSRDVDHPSACSVNPRAARETLIPRARLRPGRPPVVAVVGGGLAGLQAAIRASERGCRVTLFETSHVLGGQLLLAGHLPLLHDFPAVIPPLERRLLTLGAEIVLNQRASPDIIRALEADAVIVAAGSQSFIPDVPGLRDTPFATIEDFDPQSVPGPAVILGGDEHAVGMALTIARAGIPVTLIEVGEQWGHSGGKRLGRRLVDELREMSHVVMMSRTTVELLDEEGLVIQTNGTRSMIKLPDFVVVAAGREARSWIADELALALPEIPMLRAGDVIKPGLMAEASLSGLLAADRLESFLAG
ncbi:putative NADH oxidase [Mesorhizobium sp. SOD10]|nr:putative NADH oxidase [Mesorhizobium sp. SOD10]